MKQVPDAHHMRTAKRRRLIRSFVLQPPRQTPSPPATTFLVLHGDLPSTPTHPVSKLLHPGSNLPRIVHAMQVSASGSRCAPLLSPLPPVSKCENRTRRTGPFLGCVNQHPIVSLFSPIQVFRVESAEEGRTPKTPSLEPRSPCKGLSSRSTVLLFSQRYLAPSTPLLLSN